MGVSGEEWSRMEPLGGSSLTLFSECSNEISLPRTLMSNVGENWSEAACE